MHSARTVFLAPLIGFLLTSATAEAADSRELEQIRAEIRQLKETYETRIQDLERRLQQTETAAAQPAQNGAPASAGAFNPAVSLILSGTYANLSRNPNNYRITGFIPGGEIGPGQRGFSLTESELGISANIDPDFFGALNFSIHPDNTVSTEEAYVQTIGLAHGLTLKAGRFYAGIGYLNEQHAHVWDFVDAPLAYQAFLGGQLNDDGIQLRWLAPTDTFLELGADIGRGKNFPSSDRNKNGAGTVDMFAHIGGDTDAGSSWRAGLSYLATSPSDRRYADTDLTGTAVTNAFSGTSHLWLTDFVWKWAPGGNSASRYFKLQGEYFRRHEDGTLDYQADTPGNILPYASAQSGWYVQGVYRFQPSWRLGLRAEHLDSGMTNLGANSAFLANPSYQPSKYSLMLDYSASEFSRIRLQAAHDNSRQGMSDNQMFIQYQMSLGAHGAHPF